MIFQTLRVPTHSVVKKATFLTVNRSAMTYCFNQHVVRKISVKEHTRGLVPNVMVLSNKPVELQNCVYLPFENLKTPPGMAMRLMRKTWTKPMPSYRGVEL